MPRKIKQTNSLVPIDNSISELFDDEVRAEKKQRSLSYVPSFFTTASLPFRNVHKTVFVRKGSQGVTLTLSSPKNVPFGKYGRLLLSILTTHAVISKEKDVPVLINYESLADLLHELQLPRQRGIDVREQLECFSNAQFSFEQKVEELQSAYLFKNLYEDGNIPKGDVRVVTKTTGNIRFTEAIQYKEVIDESSKDNKFGSFKILLSAEFVAFCQRHAVPIDYTIYREITSAVGKDIYAWLVYRNNGIKEPVFIPRNRLVEQFMPTDENSNANQENVNYNRLIECIKDIKEKYYPEAKIEFDPAGAGITLYKSPTPVIKDDPRYALITSNI